MEKKLFPVSTHWEGTLWSGGKSDFQMPTVVILCPRKLCHDVIEKFWKSAPAF